MEEFFCFIIGIFHIYSPFKYVLIIMSYILCPKLEKKSLIVCIIERVDIVVCIIKKLYLYMLITKLR